MTMNLEATLKMTNEKKTRVALAQAGTILIAIMLLAGCGGGGGGDKSPVTPEKTAEELTQSGWTHFEAGSLDAALEDFDDAITRDPTYGPAYIGQGWTRLSRATGGTDLSGALTSFDNAILRQQSGADVRAGRAAVLLALGGSNLGAAVTEAQAARAASPAFVFPHRTTFGIEDLRLIEAFAQVETGAYAAALSSADAIAPSGIVESIPGSWTVGGIAYPTFHDAVLAYLHKLSTERAG